MKPSLWARESGPDVRAPCPDPGLEREKTFECLRSESLVAIRKLNPPRPWKGLQRSLKYEAGVHRWQRVPGHRNQQDGWHTSNRHRGVNAGKPIRLKFGSNPGDLEISNRRLRWRGGQNVTR